MALLAGIMVAAGSLASPTVATALVIDFSNAGSPGRMSGSTYSNGPVTAEAYYLNGSSIYVNTNTFLTVRRNTNDNGIGVCSPNELSSAACNPPATFGGGGGDTNELDNKDKRELIRLTIADNWDWVSVGISSLDGGERGRLLYSTTASVLTGAGVDALPMAAPNFVAGGPVEFSITLNAGGAAAKYLYFIPGPTGDDNDYLVWKAEVRQNVPEPATLLLLGTALTGLGIVRRRRT